VDADRCAIVVTGLPRSGTSLGMQVLRAGGVRLWTDGARAADGHNPRGYHELAAVRRLDRDNAWLRGAGGRAVKIVTPLIRHLPDGLPCRVLSMQRDLDEVLASQRAMLAGAGPVTAAEDEQRLRDAFGKSAAAAEAWLRARPATELLIVRHRDLLQDPRQQVARVAAFLGGGLDLERMAACVEPALHRQHGERRD